jgi:hypothetical protein
MLLLFCRLCSILSMAGITYFALGDEFAEWLSERK